VLIVTCLDHRVDPAIVLGLRLGDAPVIRNAGGRISPAVIDDIAYLAFLAEQLFGGKSRPTVCSKSRSSTTRSGGTGFLADPSIRHQAAEATGLPRRRWKPPRSPTRIPPSRRRRAAAHLTVALTEGERLRHVYDIATGRVTTALTPGTERGLVLVHTAPATHPADHAAVLGVGDTPADARCRSHRVAHPLLEALNLPCE